MKMCVSAHQSPNLPAWTVSTRTRITMEHRPSPVAGCHPVSAPTRFRCFWEYVADSQEMT